MSDFLIKIIKKNNIFGLWAPVTNTPQIFLNVYALEF